MAFAALLLAATVVLMQALNAAADPLPPVIDPFYTPRDENWKGQKPGFVINHRPVDLPSLIPGVESPLTAHQLLFVTRNATGHPTTSVTTIIRPQHANPNRLLSYQIAYDSPDVNCSPSFGLQKDANPNAQMWSWGQMTFVIPYLMSSKGPLGERPFINVPDYEGNNAAFTVGPQSGYHTLDSIRAALNSHNHTGIDSEARAILFGYSGGGLASEWAAELHAKEDSDLNIVGAAIGGPPPNVTNTYIHVNGTQSPLNVWAILGVMNAFPEVSDFLRDNLKLSWGSYFLGPLTRCSSPDPKPPKIPTNANVTDWFDSGDKFLYKFKHILDQYGVMGQHVNPTHRPKFPLYIYQGTKDNITAPVNDTDALYWKYCHSGTNVRYVRYEGRDHGQTLIAGMYPAWTWISSRFNRVPVLRCSVKNVTKDSDGDDDEDVFSTVDLRVDKTGSEEQSGQDKLTGLDFTHENDL
ncbi:hypothetical protein ASPVEDRAFT_41550 [Aspergillus versicolor CBS 583.65]|uniref:Lipase n=1 Tax=Aspergillus versicolor CBS 583.65 TaxID=1036611 RepID=A0A1L9PKL8_ASPVE|nr:uncharacterized protein ASPVEDRAFT_41550 [Aspergillus versicolor CBS 583.65]OJJ02033.1 hypothetical protein ASPVEDRAFT_41550 [Aspergillus versicolor CBS 583.65]